MRIDKKDYVRCIPQFTFKAGTVSLISEENHKTYPKGSLVLQVSRESVYGMYHPYPGKPQVLCECRKIKSKGVDKIIARPVLEGEYSED